jgi:Arc/MetJ family transcription regulator
MARVRINIEIEEDEYVRTIMERFGVRTTTEAVDLALRFLVGQPMTREQVLAMRGARALGDPPVDSAPSVARPGE